METNQHHNDNIMMNKQIPIAFQFILLLGLIFICSIVGGILSIGLASLFELDMESIRNLSHEEISQNRYGLRWIMGLGNLFMFFIPAILFAYFLFRRKAFENMLSNKAPRIILLPLVFLIIITFLPIIAFLLKINEAIPIPNWMASMEDSTQELIIAILKMENPWELIINLIIIALIPALGEEWIFRGIIQKKVAERINIHIAIWVTAILFSAIHFQFEGFIPRMVLGALLGYLFYWSGNLWIAVWAHFCNNAYAVLGQYFFSEQIPISPEDSPEITWWQVLIALVFSGFLLYSFYQITRHSKHA